MEALPSASPTFKRMFTHFGDNPFRDTFSVRNAEILMPVKSFSWSWRQ